MTGCSLKNEPKIEYVEKAYKIKITIPQEYFQCNMVDVNASGVKTQGDVSRLLIDMHREQEFCINNMKEIKSIIDKNNQ